MKAFNYRFPLPQPVAYWLTFLSTKVLGLGSMHAVGYFKEKVDDKLPQHTTTSSDDSLKRWQQLRMKYPTIIASCVTNNWLIQSIEAQHRFNDSYQHIRTNTLLLRYFPN